MKKPVHQKAFTLVELLIVVSVIGVLAAATVSIIDHQKQQGIARDAVKRSKMESIVVGLETYYASEGLYPSDPDNDGYPTDDPDLSSFIGTWPNDTPEGALYVYDVNGGRTQAGVVVDTSWGDVYKYRTTWGEIRECQTTTPDNDTCVVVNN